MFQMSLELSLYTGGSLGGLLAPGWSHGRGSLRGEGAPGAGARLRRGETTRGLLVTRCSRGGGLLRGGGAPDAGARLREGGSTRGHGRWSGTLQVPLHTRCSVLGVLCPQGAFVSSPGGGVYFILILLHCQCCNSSEVFSRDCTRGIISGI